MKEQLTAGLIFIVFKEHSCWLLKSPAGYFLIKDIEIKRFIKCHIVLITR